MAGAAILALLMNAPQVKADDIVVFGGEFEDEAPAPKKVTKPEPIRELPPEPQPPPPAQIEKPPVETIQPPIEEKPVETVQPPVEEKPAEPPPIEQPPVEPAPPVEEKPEIVTPKDKPPTQPLEQPAEPAQPAQVPPQDVSVTLPEEDEDHIGDTLIFDDLKQTPEQKPLEQPQQPPVIEKPPTPAQIEEPPTEIEQPFGRPSKIPAKEPVVVVPPTPQLPAQSIEPTTPIQEPMPQQKPRRSSTPRHSAPPKNLKTLQQRFMKLAVDDTYTYYLDKNSVQWKKMPYSTSEYIADVWIRMVEREPKELDDDMASYGADNFNAEISLARDRGYQYAPDDVNVLRSQAYVLEHYYLRPKTRQIQFLCELEVFGRPQNTVSERAYDYKNWENLVPGSVESVIYEATLKIIGEWKSTERGHMTFSDMLDEYLRISL